MKALRLVLLALFVVGALFSLNTLIPQPQTTQAETIGNNDPCGHLSVWINENPNACKDTKVQSSMTSYQATLGLQYKTNNVGPIHVVVNAVSHFCPTRADLTGSNAGCYQHEAGNPESLTLGFGDTQRIPAPMRSPSVANSAFAGQACGYYQDDFAFTYTDPQTHASCTIGSVSNTAINAGTASFCNAGRDCVISTPTATPTPPTQQHLACVNNACVEVAGAGSDSCNKDSADSCAPQQHHNICQNFACVQVDGAGTSTCNTPADNSSECSHLTCQSNACTRVTGSGSDSCSTDDNCKTQKHLACVDNSCQLIDGVGSDTCTTQGSSCNTGCTGDNCTTTIINNNNPTINVQQQQQQAVLAASVQPAVTTTQLPSTGSGTEVLFTLLGLLPIGFKLRKLV